MANTFARLGSSVFRRIPPIRKAMTIPLPIVTTKHLQIDIFHQLNKLFDNLFGKSKKTITFANTYSSLLTIKTLQSWKQRTWKPCVSVVLAYSRGGTTVSPLYRRVRNILNPIDMPYFLKKETLDDIWIGVCILIIIASHSQLKWLYHLIFPISVIWAVCFSLVLFAEWKTENSIKNVMLHILKKNKEILFGFLVPYFSQ